MKNKKIYPRHIKKIIEMRNDGATLELISQKYGVSREWIRQLLKREGYGRCFRIAGNQRVNPIYKPRHVKEQLFWESVKLGNKDECWEWTGGKYPTGYGRFGKVGYAHRLAYEYIHGPIPDGLVICHKCNNPGCVNPFHTYAGTMADNMADREARYANGELKRHPFWMHGGRGRHPRPLQEAE